MDDGQALADSGEPQENCRRLVDEVPNAVPDPVLVEIATRSIAGLDEQEARAVVDEARGTNTPDNE